jgi:hypothetical protein
MKIAVLLTGQLRTFNMVKYLHLNSLISQYDTDVFLSIDLDNSLQCLYKNNKSKTNMEDAKNAINFFKPKGHFILEDFNAEFNKIKQINPCIRESEKLLFEQYYVVKNAYRLMLEHIDKTNTKYDAVIRLRFDQFIWSNECAFIFQGVNKIGNKIIYNKENIDKLNAISKGRKIIVPFLADNNIYLFGWGPFKDYNYANEQFWYHNHSLIKMIYNFYDDMPKLLENAIKNNKGQQGALIEHLWYKYITKNKINMNKSSIRGEFVREFAN